MKAAWRFAEPAVYGAFFGAVATMKATEGGSVVWASVVVAIALAALIVTTVRIWLWTIRRTREELAEWRKMERES